MLSPAISFPPIRLKCLAISTVVLNTSFNVFGIVHAEIGLIQGDRKEINLGSVLSLYVFHIVKVQNCNGLSEFKQDKILTVNRGF